MATRKREPWICLVITRFLACNLALLCLFVTGVGSKNQSDVVSVVIFLAMVLLHVRASFLIERHWPRLAKSKERYGESYFIGGGIIFIAIFGLSSLFAKREEQAAQCAVCVALLWAAFVLIAAMALGHAMRTARERRRAIEAGKKAEQNHAATAEARKRVEELIRKKYDRFADLIDLHYNEADLAADLHRYCQLGDDASAIHDQANRLLAKIDGYRAYETVRQACLAEPQGEAKSVAWHTIDHEAQRLLVSHPSLADIRQLESRLLARVRTLAALGPSSHQNEDQCSSSLPTEDEIAAVVAKDVRADAQPDDTDEDIQREIRHRLRGIQKTCVG